MPGSSRPVRASRRNRMLEMTNENFARLLRGLTFAVGKRRNRILLYQFLAAEIRALHCSYGIGDGESYKRALTFLENCEACRSSCSLVLAGTKRVVGRCTASATA